MRIKGPRITRDGYYFYIKQYVQRPSCGKYTAPFDTDNYTSTDDFVDAVFEKFDASVYAPMIVDTKDVNYKGVDCKEYTLKATIPVSIEGVSLKPF